MGECLVLADLRGGEQHDFLGETGVHCFPQSACHELGAKAYPQCRRIPRQAPLQQLDLPIQKRKVVRVMNADRADRAAQNDHKVGLGGWMRRSDDRSRYRNTICHNPPCRGSGRATSNSHFDFCGLTVGMSKRRVSGKGGPHGGIGGGFANARVSSRSSHDGKIR